MILQKISLFSDIFETLQETLGFMEHNEILIKWQLECKLPNELYKFCLKTVKFMKAMFVYWAKKREELVLQNNTYVQIRLSDVQRETNMGIHDGPIQKIMLFDTDIVFL